MNKQARYERGKRTFSSLSFPRDDTGGVSDELLYYTSCDTETKPLPPFSASTFFFNTILLSTRLMGIGNPTKDGKVATINTHLYRTPPPQKKTKLAATPLNCLFTPGNETHITYVRQVCRHSKKTKKQQQNKQNLYLDSQIEAGQIIWGYKQKEWDGQGGSFCLLLKEEGEKENSTNPSEFRRSSAAICL